MLVRGIAKKLLSSVTRHGKMSPGTMDLGFLNFLILADTSNFCSSGRVDSRSVIGIWSGSRGSNSPDILIK